VNPDGQSSAALNFAVELAPRPEILSLSPNSAQARGAAFVLTLQGRNFQSGAAVRWNGTALNTTFLSATQVTADVAANLLATAGAASIVVANPDGQATAPVSFTIAARPPRITSVAPNSVQATGPAFVLRITGSDFAGTATVRWNSTALATTFVSESELTANVPANLILSPGAVSLIVTNGDGQSSESAAFTISAAPAPSISALSPNTAQATGAAFTLTVDGANFQNGAVVRWNGAALATSFVSATRLTAAVAADLIATAASPAVVVANPDGQTSAAIAFTITAAPAPLISALDPSVARAGDPAFAMAIAGSNFQSGAIVRWNGSPVPTVFVSSTRLSASVGAALIAAAGQAPVTVVNPDGQISAPVNFRINAPPPRILSFVPTSIQAAGPSFTLVVQGSDFQSGAVVRWNGGPVTTSFDSPGQLSASIAAALIQNPGTAAIAVLNPDGQTSAPVNFSIGAAPAPLLTSLSPSSAQAGSAAFTLTLNGSNFQPGAVARWNGSPLTTLQSGAAQLTASVPAELIAAAGSVPVTVQNPDGQTSTAVSFVVAMAPPRITSLNPASATAGGAAFTLTVLGSGFQSGAAVLWSGAALNTTFVSASQLTAAAPASLITQAATIQIAVRNPDNQVSNESAFPVSQAPRPTISSVNPASVTAGLASQVFTVNGANFRSGAVVSWGGTQLATTFVSAAQVTALATGPLLATPASVALTLRNPDGQTSDAFAVNVTAPAPLLSLLTPASAPAGSPEFTLRIAGQNFRPGMEARWNATALPTVVNSATEIAAIVGASLLATPGSAAVTVSTSDGTVSAALPFTILNPVPQLFSVSPSSVAAGSGALRLTIAGDRFVQGAQVLFNGNALATSFAAPNQLTAQVPADLLARPGNAAIAVRNPENQTSNSLRFTITEVAVPEISRLNPSSAAANGPAFALSVSGFNFLNGADVLWNGAVLQTTFVSPTQLTANVPATLLTAQGQSAITVRNPGGQTSQPAAFEIGPPLLITTAAELEDAPVGRALKVEFAASGGARPYRWAVAAGSTLPEGLTLDGAGVLQGTPLAPAAAQFEIEVRDSVNAVDRRRFRLKILPRLLEILSRSPLPAGAAGLPYSFRFELSESNLPDLVWSLLDGQLPAGLSVNPATGELAGVPTEPEAGDSTPLAVRFRIQAVSGERTAVKEFDLTVAPSLTGLSLATPATLPDGQVGRPYQGRIAAVGGRPPYNYSVTAGSLPAGIQFSAAGSLDGTPQQAGAFSFTVDASDAAGRTAARQYALRITALPPVQITSGPVLPVAIPGQPYTFLLNATGGRTPYRWILLSGGFPPGLTFDPRAGRIAGTPLREGVFRFLVQVIEAGGASDRRELQIPVLISGDDPVRFTTAALPPATLGDTYRAPLAALGGLPPYRFTVAAGLPEGLRLEGDAIAGAPVQPGAFRVLVTVTDSRGARADREYALVVSMAALSAVTIGGIPETLNPGQQSQLLIELASPYPVEITGRMEVEFVSAGAISPGDPALQFSTGGRAVDFRIPAGQTRAVFPQSPFGVQTGTVAGSLLFRLTFRAAGHELRPANAPEKTILIPQTAPVISSATLARTAGGFDLIVSGFSPTREVIEGVVTFIPAPGREIQSTRVTIPLGSAFQAWFANSASQAFGSQFRMVLPFTGDASSLDSLTVVLRNTRGSSAEVRAAF
jgi:alpha-D-ribose 1-methylphosphonate 5-triphosphate synthase subunit PhnH